MPQMADIVVKKADNTTNVTFVAKVPSSGDKSPSLWTQDAASTYRNQRPKLSVTSQFNGPKTARRINIACDFPVIRNIDGLPQVAHTIPFSTVVTIPMSVVDTEADEAAAQFGNLLASTLMRAIVSSGYSAT